jgi:hypothetical protein
MLWLINQATAGQITGQTPAPSAGEPREQKKEGLLAPAGGAASFGDIKIDMGA